MLRRGALVRVYLRGWSYEPRTVRPRRLFLTLQFVQLTIASVCYCHGAVLTRFPISIVASLAGGRRLATKSEAARRPVSILAPLDSSALLRP